MDFDQLETFLEVARLSSFSRAAERRFRTQPAISAECRRRQIGAVEPWAAAFGRRANRRSVVNFNVVLPLLFVAVSLVFCLLLFGQWRGRRHYSGCRAIGCLVRSPEVVAHHRVLSVGYVHRNARGECEYLVRKRHRSPKLTRSIPACRATTIMLTAISEATTTTACRRR